MAYCVYSDVADLLLGDNFTATSKITTTKLTEIIVDTDVWIDAMLYAYYAVPITAIESLKVMKIISQNAAAAEVLRRINAGITGTKTGNKAGKDYLEFAENIIKKIQVGELKLSDATPVGSDIVLTGKYDDSGEERTPKFKIDDKF